MPAKNSIKVSIILLNECWAIYFWMKSRFKTFAFKFSVAPVPDTPFGALVQIVTAAMAARHNYFFFSLKCRKAMREFDAGRFLLNASTLHSMYLYFFLSEIFRNRWAGLKFNY